MCSTKKGFVPMLAKMFFRYIDRSRRNMARSHALLAAVLLSALAPTARAGQLYSFSFTPSSAPMDAFAFSFTAPDFVTTGESLAFTPFTITDGANSAILTMGIAETNPPGSEPVSCFDFLTASNSFFILPCGFGFSDTGGVPAMDFFNALPTADGTYSTTDADAEISGGNDIISGTVNLTVSSVSSAPEPSSAILIGPILLAVGYKSRKRIAQYRGSATGTTKFETVLNPPSSVPSSFAGPVRP